MLQLTAMQKLLIGFISAILALQAIVVWQEWYITQGWVDIPLHIAGGAWLALLFFYLFEERIPTVSPAAPWWSRAFLAVGFAVFIGSGWEVFEYVIAVLGHHFTWGDGNGKTYFDTLKDIVNVSIGGFVAAVWHVRRLSR